MQHLLNYDLKSSYTQQMSKNISYSQRWETCLYSFYRQLTHPLVSPVFQGSLGNLCPLYIIAGNDEALRDEIIYLAHRAAYPQNFPPRVEAVKEAERQMENVEKFKSPTNVHLQVFDGIRFYGDCLNETNSPVKGCVTF